MDQKTLINKLNTVFCRKNREDKKYSEVWLSDVDFGGMFDSGKFVLNIKAEHTIDNCNDEIFSIVNMLNSEAPEVFEKIWRVVVYNPDDTWHCYTNEDILVYTEASACV
jgi:hypothetical protein